MHYICHPPFKRTTHFNWLITKLTQKNITEKPRLLQETMHFTINYTIFHEGVKRFKERNYYMQ